MASETLKSREGDILRLLSVSTTVHTKQAFIPRLLNEFAFDGPNGRHICLVQEAAICTIANAKEDSGNFMFLAETARSIAAQLILGLAYCTPEGFVMDSFFSNHSKQAAHRDKGFWNKGCRNKSL